MPAPNEDPTARRIGVGGTPIREEEEEAGTHLGEARPGNGSETQDGPNDGYAYEPASPFAPAPSARPPSLADANAPITVSAPNIASDLEPLPLSRRASEPPPRASDEVQPAAASAAGSAAERGPTPRRVRAVAAVAIAAGAIGLLTLVGWSLRACTRQSEDPGPNVAAAHEAYAEPSAGISASMAPSASPAPSVVSARSPAVAAVAASPRTKPFDPRAARAALDAVAPKFSECKVPNGRTGRVQLTFSPNGSVASATPLAPYAGTKEGACVASHLKKVHVAPFTGPAMPYVYTFGTHR